MTVSGLPSTMTMAGALLVAGLVHEQQRAPVRELADAGAHLARDAGRRRAWCGPD